MVLEAAQDNQVREFCGILKDYTDSFITILNVPVAEEHEFHLSDAKQLEVNRDLDFKITPLANMQVQVTNKGQEAVHLAHVEGTDYSEIVDRDVAPGTTEIIELPGVPLFPVMEVAQDKDAGSSEPETVPALPDVRLWIRAQRFKDMIVSRSMGKIRHGAESIGGRRIALLDHLPRIRVKGK